MSPRNQTDSILLLKRSPNLLSDEQFVTLYLPETVASPWWSMAELVTRRRLVQGSPVVSEGFKLGGVRSEA